MEIKRGIQIKFLKFFLPYKKIWQIAYPIMISYIVQNIIAATDTAFIGQLGKAELGAAAIGGVFYSSICILGIGLCIGSQIIIARRNGENKQHEIGDVFHQTLYSLIFFAIILFIVMSLFSASLFQVLLNSDNVARYSYEYFQYRLFGLVISFINIAFGAFYTGIAKTRVISYATVLVSVVNIVFDYFLVFGISFFPRLGIRGAAIASVLAECSCLIFYIFYTLSKKELTVYRLLPLSKINFRQIFDLFKISLPLILRNLMSLGSWLIFFVLIENLSEDTLAISNIVRNIYFILMIPMNGFANATNTLVSYYIGKGRIKKNFPLLYRIIILCLSSVALLAVVILLFRTPILSLFSRDKDLVINANPVLFVVCFSSLILSVSVVLFETINGMGNTKISFFIEVVIMSLFLIQAYLSTSIFHLPLYLIWLTELVYSALMGVFSYFYLKSGKWKNTLKKI